MAAGAGFDLYKFSYASVNFNATRLRALEYQAVYNGPDYLFSQIDLHLHGFVNVSDRDFVKGRVTSPAFFVQQIEKELALPRQELILSMPSAVDFDPPEGENVLLSVKIPKNMGDRQDISLDCNNGPIPLYARVNQVVGTSTILVDFGVRTWVNLRNAKNEPPVLLSNRWVTTHNMDQDWFTHITTRGRAVFRADMLTKMKLRPDDFRPWLLVPIPETFHRQGVMVQQSMDQTTIEYVTEDRELALVPQNSLVTRMQVSTSIHTETPSAFQAEMARSQAARAVSNMVQKNVDRGFRTAADLTDFRNPSNMFWNWAKLPVDAGIGLGELAGLVGIDARPLELMQIAELRRSGLPQTIFTSHVDVWGYPHTPMGTLSQVAASTACEIVANAEGLKHKAGRAATLQSDLTNRHVRFDLRFLVDPDVGAALAKTTDSFQIAGVDATAFKELAYTNEVATFYERKGQKGGPWLQKEAEKGKYPSGRFLYRGSFLERMVAQTLQTPVSNLYIKPTSATDVTREKLKEEKLK